jgi:hypothetical protein
MNLKEVHIGLSMRILTVIWVYILDETGVGKLTGYRFT